MCSFFSVVVLISQVFFFLCYKKYIIGNRSKITLSKFLNTDNTNYEEENCYCELFMYQRATCFFSLLLYADPNKNNTNTTNVR